ncbi:MAG: 3-hydroxyacyl-CoA dehydrogenase family protein, partial [Oceanobacter sp.]
MSEVTTFRSLLTEVSDLRDADHWQQQSIAELPKQISEQDTAAFAAIEQVAVIGSGAMGRCIAIAFARLGKQVTVIDASEDALQAALTFITGYVAGQQKKGKLSDEAALEFQARFEFAAELDAIAGCGLVVEAVPEILSLKQQVMQQLAERVSADCILATNTSTLDLDAIADAVPNPER